jgi:SAM-dependent methyltransferase
VSLFYGVLAPWWPLVSPVEDYAAEAAYFARLLRERLPERAEVLELGSGGGHNAFHLKRHFTLTLTDLSDEMLALSRQLNPDCAHLQGDMRTLDVKRTFDGVFVHDALSYLTTEAELVLTLSTAARHLRPGGVLLLVPDEVTETFEPGSESGGVDAPDGRGIRYLEWVHPVPEGQTRGVTDYAFVVKEADGTRRFFHEAHPFGLFPRAVWEALVTRAGFSVETLTEETDEPRPPRLLFRGVKLR